MSDTDLQVIVNGRSGTTTVSPELAVDYSKADRQALLDEIARLRAEIGFLRAHVD